MKKFYLPFLLVFSMATLCRAQMTVNVVPGDSTLEAAIGTAVDNGTANETTFILARGGTYLLTRDIRNENFHLSIAAEEGEGERPTIRTREKNRPFRLRGDFTMKGIILSGIAENGEVDNHMIRTDEAIKITIDDCHISGNYASAFRLDEPAIIKLTNTIFTNFIGIEVDGDGNEVVGSEEERQGVVFRDRAGIDSLIVENCSFYNIGGEVYKNASEGDTKNLISFNHCTFVNVGQTGLELDETLNATVTNCQFVNVGLLGSLNIADSTTDVFGIRLVATEGQSATISNNNFYLDSTYLANLPDTSKQVANLNPVADSLADTASFLNENVLFNTMPAGYSYQTGWTRMVDADFGYSQDFASYTGGVDGSIIGDSNWDFDEGSVDINSPESIITDLVSYPNPADHSMILSLQNQSFGYAKLDIINTTGTVVLKIFEGNLPKGKNEFKLDLRNIASGLYIGRVLIQNKLYQQKFIVK